METEKDVIIGELVFKNLKWSCEGHTQCEQTQCSLLYKIYFQANIAHKVTLPSESLKLLQYHSAGENNSLISIRLLTETKSSPEHFHWAAASGHSRIWGTWMPTHPHSLLQHCQWLRPRFISRLLESQLGKMCHRKSGKLMVRQRKKQRNKPERRNERKRKKEQKRKAKSKKREVTQKKNSITFTHKIAFLGNSHYMYHM